MNKDNLIFAVFGILVGFISGYLMHEVVASRQPPRLTPELRAQIAMPGEDPTAPGAGPTDARGADLGMGGGAPGSGPAMEQVQQLRAYVEQNPDDADAVLQLANMNFDIRNWTRAVELYNQYLKLRPGDANVLTDLGVAYQASQEYDQALATFDEAQKLAPDNWKAYYNEVIVLAFDLKRFDDAERVLAELQRLQPGNPDVQRLADEVSRRRNAA
jgi:cytochrome c-type biogenesis protein CcmH/NrfG